MHFEIAVPVNKMYLTPKKYQLSLNESSKRIEDILKSFFLIALNNKRVKTLNKKNFEANDLVLSMLD